MKKSISLTLAGLLLCSSRWCLKLGKDVRTVSGSDLIGLAVRSTLLAIETRSLSLPLLTHDVLRKIGHYAIPSCLALRSSLSYNADIGRLSWHRAASPQDVLSG
jgi:hypothetical protein